MWRSVEAPNIGLLGTIDTKICQEQSAGRISFPDFSSTDRLLIVSDYAGGNNDSKFESYSFLILGHAAWAEWEVRRRSIRQALDIPRRRLSYKRLRDKYRHPVLSLLLRAVGSLQGLSLTFAVAKSVGSLFVPRESVQIPMAQDRFAVWKPRVLEHALRVSTFVGFLLAGLSSPNQDVFWITDQDPIASDQERLTRLTEMLALISSNLLPHNLRNLRCGTTAIDDGTLQVEDLASIPDLVAGSVAALHTGYADQSVRLGAVIAPAPASLGWRAHAVLDWLSDRTLVLTRVLLLIEPETTGSTLSVKHVRLHGTGIA